MRVVKNIPYTARQLILNQASVFLTTKDKQINYSFCWQTCAFVFHAHYN